MRVKLKFPRKQKLLFTLLFSCLFLLLSVSVTQAATLRVPQNYSTIEVAYSAANHGDTILVAPGTYNNFCLSGKRTKRIILRAEHPATTSPTNQHSILNSGCSHVVQFKTPLDNDGVFHPGEVVEFNGFVLNGSDDGFSYEGASGIVKDNIIQNQGDDPIDIDGGSEAHITGNMLKNGGNDGIENRLHSFSSSRVIQMIFRNNIIYKNNNDGIQLIYQGAGNSKRKYLIANNLIIGNGDVGIGTSPDTKQNSSGYPFQESMYVLHNTFVNNNKGGILGGANMKVHNNIFYNNKVAGVKNVGGSSVVSHNLFFGNTTDHQGSNVQNPNVFADPKFTNTGSPPNFSSYQLGSGSPAIDAGKNVASMYSEFGVSPPAYKGSAPDLGWLESGAAPPPPTTPTPTKPPPPTLPGDIDKDGDVDIFDYNLIIQHFGNTSCGNVADIDGNCKVDIFDYNTLIENFGK